MGAPCPPPPTALVTIPGAPIDSPPPPLMETKDYETCEFDETISVEENGKGENYGELDARNGGQPGSREIDLVKSHEPEDEPEEQRKNRGRKENGKGKSFGEFDARNGG